MPDRSKLPPKKLGDAISDARKSFAEACLEEPAVDARVLVSGLLSLSATDLIVQSGQVLTEDEQALINAAISRRVGGEPVHRILGFREFYGLNLRLSPETLEPRPDTEILVDRVLPFLKDIIRHKGSARVLDLGTGTGAICLALLHECPQATGVGVDVSGDALATATLNADENGLGDRFEALESDWFSKVDGSFDVIVSNPPYIPSADIASLSREVRDYDPLAALDGGPDGLEPYRLIANALDGYLSDGGIAAVEIGWDQKNDVGVIFEQAGFAIKEAVKDYGGQDRAMIFARCKEQKLQ